MDNTPGRVLADRYRIEEVLHGGQSDVLRATDTTDNQQVAIKTPNEATRSDERRLQRFVEAMVTHAQIEHENVLRVHRYYEAGEIDDGHYLVADWMDQTLETVLEGEPLDVPTALDIIKKLLHGLGAIHKFETLHRDLKPSNIFLSNDLTRVCIGDLGGREGTLDDSFKYTPPETFDEDHETDERGDLYSLGLIAYELLLGRVSFKEQFSNVYSAPDEAGQRARWINWHRDSEQLAPPLSTVNPEIPLGVSNAIAALLSKNPAVRPTDAEVALTALEAGATEQAAQAVPVLKLEAEDEVTGLASWLTGNKLYATIGGGVVALGLIGFVLFGGGEGLNLTGLTGGETGGIEQPEPIGKPIRPDLVIEEEKKLQIVLPTEVVVLENGDYVIIGGTEGGEIKLEGDTTVTAGGLTFGKGENGELIATDAAGNELVRDANGNWVRKATVDGAEVDLVANEDGTFTDPTTGKKYKCDEDGCVEIDPATGLPINADGSVTAKIDGKDVNLVQNADGTFTDPTTGKKFKCDENGCLEIDPETGLAIKTALIDGKEVKLTQNADGTFTDPLTGKKYKCDENGCVEIDAASGLVENPDGSFKATIDGKEIDLVQNPDGTFTDPKTGKKYKCIDGECFEVTDENMPKAFQIGSTEEEKAAALELCLQYDDACNLTWFDDEYLREVELAPFEIDTREVTNKEFADFVAATGHVTDAEKTGQAWRWVGFASMPARGFNWKQPSGPGSRWQDKPDHPVVAVSARDAAAFCEWIGSRLPSEDEWEYAARGIERRIFPWGDEWDPSLAHWKRDKGATTRPAGSTGGTTPEGAYDMAGSVWEWTTTLEGQLGVLKGGSYEEENPANQRSAVRRLSPPNEGHIDDGFRCVSAPEAR